MLRWLAVLVLGIAVGAATILLADPGTSEPRVLVTPAGASSADSAPIALNGQHVHGVKAGDIAAESQPDQPLDAATRDQLSAQLMASREVAMRYPTTAD